MSPSSDPRYELLREIGRGGGGVVWLGRDRVSGHEVAIKTAAPGDVTSSLYFRNTTFPRILELFL